MSFKNTFLLIFVLGILIDGLSSQSMNISLNALGSCSTATSFRVGDSCQFEMVIQIPTQNATTMHVELFTSDNSSTVMAQLCKPTIKIGSNYNITSVPIPELTSSLDNYIFDQAIIEFGTIQNSGLNTDYDSTSIVITFSVNIIQNYQQDGDSIWITAGAEYYNGDEIWIGQSSLTFNSSTTGTPGTDGFNSSTAISNEVGKFGTYTARLNIASSNYINVSLTATSSDLYPSNAITVCSIHISTTGWCYECLNSIKAYVGSKYAKDANSVTLDLGYLVNRGYNTKNMTGANYIDIFVAFKVSQTALPGTNNTITLVATIGSSTKTHTQIVNIIASAGSANAPTPAITPLIETSPISIYQAFNLTIIIEFPYGYDHSLQVDAIPNQGTSDGSLRVKLCSVVVTSSGENLPCPKCMNQGTLNTYSQNSSVDSIHDSLTWSIESVKNYNLRTIQDKLNVNQMTLSIIGQVLNNTMNTEGSNITIPIGITFGNQTIWVSEGLVISRSSANFSSTNESFPTFSMSLADTGNDTANIKEPRAIYFDIYTKPGSVLIPMDVEIVMPETLIGNNIPAATVCSVKMVYVGIYAQCAQQNYVNLNRISYLERMISFKKDKAIVKLDSLCNSADENQKMDPIDGMVRFLIYFQLDDTPSLPDLNYIAVGVKYTYDQIYVGQALFNKGTKLPFTNQATSVTGFKTNSSDISILGNQFGSGNYVFKIPPKSLFGYRFETNLTTSNPDKISFCTIRIVQQGSNVPCSNQFNHIYKYSNVFTKNYALSYMGPICSINNISTSINSTEIWDEDSVNLQIITRPKYDASGTYSIGLKLMDEKTNFTLDTESYSFTVSPGSASAGAPNASLINSNIISVDPTDSSSLVFANTNYMSIYKGQTSIIRYNLTITDKNSFDVKLIVSSNLPQDKFEIIRFYLSNIGVNFPCQSMNNPVTLTNGSSYTYSATLDIGNVAYFDIDPSNASASTLTFEAHVRIPYTENSNLGSFTFTVTPQFNNIPQSSITQTTTSFTVKDINLLNTTVLSNLTSNFTQSTQLDVSIRQSVKLNLSINIPPNSNLRALLNVSCINSQAQVCSIQSLNIKSMGRNIDGLLNEHKLNKLVSTFTRNLAGAVFYNDSCLFDLGIITNTNYGQKLGTYDPTVDDLLQLELNVLIVDDIVSDNNKILTVSATSMFNNVSNIFNQQLRLVRTSSERPFLIINSTFSNDTNLIFSSNSIVSIRFEIYHADNSTAEAYNVKIAFYLPLYVKFLNIAQQNASFGFTPVLNDTTLYFLLSRLHFGEKATCVFNVVIDPDNKYTSFIQNFKYVPNTLRIPFNLIYKKINRTQNDIINFYTILNSIEYKPSTVVLQALNDPLKSKILFNPCRLTSSVADSTPNQVFSTGWKVGYRSIQWLSSKSSYLTISFGDEALISKISLKQLDNLPSNTPLSKYIVGYSYDNFSFTNLPAMSNYTDLGQNFDFIPQSGPFKCKYLRIYITNVTNSGDLSNKVTGLIINEIFGSFNELTSINSICVASTFSSFYKPRSYLYVQSNLYVCDETLDRSSSECYSSSDSSSSSWTILPKIVSTIVFWIKDQNSLKEYLYGVASDKTNYVRSDDNGLNWKAVSFNEFNTMYTTPNQRYSRNQYSELKIFSTSPTNFGQWQIDVQGIKFSNTLVFDWFN